MTSDMLHIVMVSCPGVGHIRPLLSLATEIIRAHDNFIVTVFGILTDTHLKKTSFECDESRVRFHRLLDQFHGLPYDPRYARNAAEYVSDMIAYIDSCSLPIPICHVYDMFAGWSQLLAHTYKIPTYLFMPCSLRACALSFPPLPPKKDESIDERALQEFKVEILMRSEMQTMNKVSNDAELLDAQIATWTTGDGMLINDVIELSSEIVAQRLREHSIRKPYRIFTIGPVGLENDNENSASLHQSDENLEWLSTHPANSAIYVALGSWCELPLQDLCELAYALKSLDVPVLWAYRGIASDTKKEYWISDRELVDSVDEDGLPMNFRNEIESSRFRIVPWVNQKRVLQHPSLQLFVSHCGWNSTIEALSLLGKPIVALPIGAEQGFNAIDIEYSFEVGKRLWRCHTERRLDRLEVAATLREVMRNPIYRQNAKHAQELIRKARSHNGSSTNNMMRFLSTLCTKNTP